MGTCRLYKEPAGDVGAHGTHRNLQILEGTHSTHRCLWKPQCPTNIIRDLYHPWVLRRTHGGLQILQGGYSTHGFSGRPWGHTKPTRSLQHPWVLVEAIETYRYHNASIAPIGARTTHGGLQILQGAYNTLKTPQHPRTP